MRKLNIEDAIELLENTCAVIVDGDWLCYPSVDGEDAVHWLELYDVNSDEYFYFSDSADPYIDDNNHLVLTSDDDEKFELTLLNITNLE